MTTPLLESATSDGAEVIDLDREPLTAGDRCDACSAQAFVAATVNGCELVYCAHHGTKFEANLLRVATSWHDQRGDLAP